MRDAKAWISLTGPLAVVLLSLLVVLIAFPALTTIASFAMINLIAVVALYVFVGNSGILSFGHIAFVAIGAYVSAIVTMSPDTKKVLLPDLPEFMSAANVPFAAGVVLAALVAALAALVFGIPLMRLNGLAAGIGTLALLIIVRDVARNWKAVTGGAGTLNGIPIHVTLPIAAAIACAAIVIAFAYQSSRRGRLVRSTREDRVAAVALGVNVYRERLVAFVLSAGVAGAAGAVYAGQLGSIAIDSFYLQLTFIVLAMLVIGGMTSIWGAVVGVFLVTLVQEGFRVLEGPRGLSLPSGIAPVVVGLALLAVLLFRPQGVTGGRELGELLRWKSPRRPARPESGD